MIDLNLVELKWLSIKQKKKNTKLLIKLKIKKFKLI